MIKINQVSVTAKRPGWLKRTIKKVGRFLASLNEGGSGESIPGGLNLVTSGTPVAPTRTTSENPNDIETINIDDLLPAIGGAEAGPLGKPSLPVAKGLSKIYGIVNEVSNNKKTSDRAIKESTGDKTDGHGKSMRHTLSRTRNNGTTDTIYWINNSDDTISVAGGVFNGELYYPRDTMSQIIRNRKGIFTTVVKETKYPSR